MTRSRSGSVCVSTEPLSASTQLRRYVLADAPIPTAELVVAQMKALRKGMVSLFDNEGWTEDRRDLVRMLDQLIEKYQD